MIPIFKWPDRGPHKNEFLVFLTDSARCLDQDQLLHVTVGLLPIADIPESTTITSVFQTVGTICMGEAMRAPGDQDNPDKAYRIAINRALRAALARQGFTDVWNETYHFPRRKAQPAYCIKVDAESGLLYAGDTHDEKRLPKSLPAGNRGGIAPIPLLPRIVAHAIAQRATVNIELGFRHNLTLHYGKTNCVDGHKGWTMAHYWPKSTGEGEPDDFDMKEWVIREFENPAEVFTAKAKQLLRLE